MDRALERFGTHSLGRGSTLPAAPDGTRHGAGEARGDRPVSRTRSGRAARGDGGDEGGTTPVV